MRAEEYLHAGDLDRSLQTLQEQVRQEPSRFELRVFLFQLLVLMGQWERALKQLQVCASLDASALPMAQTYRETIRCEALREQVFAGRRSPLLFGEPEPWMADLLQSLRHTAEAQHGQAENLRAQALDGAPTTAGTLNGTPFSWIADADSRLGPMLEAIINGRYYWIPFARLRSVHIEPPADLRDLAWLPAQLTSSQGGELVGFIPTRYPRTHESEDGPLRLARKTEWSEQGSATFCGLGQRILVTDATEMGLLDARAITLELSPDDSPTNAATDG